MARPGAHILSPVPGTLYVVATPIGNLEDLSIRAARVLADVELVAAENTRVAAKLLRHLELDPRRIPYNDRNKRRQTAPILRALEEGRDVALISDAGTPGISDPGADLVHEAVAAGVAVVPIPGASAVTALLSVAGLGSAEVRLLGFLPRRRVERRRLLSEIAERGVPALAFESPHRIVESLEDIEAALPDAALVIGRELTKLHEQVWRGNPTEARRAFGKPRGEFCLVIAPGSRDTSWTDDRVREELAAARAAGESRSAAARRLARAAGRPRSQVYALWPDDPAAS